MEKSEIEKSPFSNACQVGVIVRDIDEAVEEIEKLVIEYPKNLAENKISTGIEFMSEVGEIVDFEGCLGVARHRLGHYRILAYQAESEYKEATEGEKDPPFKDGEEFGKRLAKEKFRYSRVLVR